MTEFIDGTLEALCAEADRRLNDSDRELAQDIVLRAQQQYNELDLPDIAADDQLVRCVGSRLLDGSVADAVKLRGNTVYRRREYTPMRAEAYYAALRLAGSEDGESAAFYATSASMQLSAVEASSSFRETMMSIFDKLDAGTLSELRYKHLEGEGLPEDILKSEQYPTELTVLGIPDQTQVTLTQYGINTLSKPPQFGIEASMTGPARLRVLPKRFLKVDADKVWQGPGRQTIVPITIGPDSPVVSRQFDGVFAGDQITVLPFGQLEEPGSKADIADSDYERFLHNPTISPEDALRFLDNGNAIPWTEVTGQFFNTFRSQFRAACSIDADAQHQLALEQARTAITEQFSIRKAQPLALGYLAVGKRIGEMVKTFSQESNRLVNASFFSK